MHDGRTSFEGLLCRTLAFAGFLLLASAGTTLAATPGVVLDYQTGKAILFDADTDTIIGSVPLGANIGSSGDCVVLGDTGPAFATDFGFRIWGLDLEGATPRLSDPPNPIRISNPGEDIAVTEDARHLVICDGSGEAPV